MGIRKTNIELRCPNGNGTFTPGQTLQGDLVFQITGYKPHHVSAIVVKIRGAARTYWTETSGSGDNETTTTHSETQKLIFHDVILTNLVEKQYGGLAIPPGQHRIPFHFTLPYGLPPSTRIGDGTVKYQLKARVLSKSCFSFNGKNTFAFTVQEHYDLNTNPDLAMPLQMTGMTEKSLFKKSVGHYQIHMSQRGFTCGETVRISVDGSPELLHSLQNSSAEVKLKKRYICRAGGSTRGSKKTLLTFHPHDWSRVQFDVPHGTMMSIPADMCSIINVFYYVKIKSKHLKMQLPMTIGTVPVRPS